MIRPSGTEHVGTAAPGRPADRRSATNDAVVLSGGNFHGEPVAFALDFLGIALSALAGISERRLERLVNPSLNEGLPPFLAPEAGLNSGFMMPQVTAAALVSENKVLAHPASVDSITTSGNKEDYVSMGMTAALKLRRIVENARNVLAIEAIAAAQALDFMLPLKTSPRGQKAYDAIRAVCPRMEKDRAMYGDFARVAKIIADGKLRTALE
jgi:histidine ammonia-lyase